MLPSPAQLLRLLLEAPLAALAGLTKLVEAGPRRARIARRQAAQIERAVTGIGTDVSDLRNAIEPVPDTLDAVDGRIDRLLSEVTDLRTELHHVSGEVDQITTVLPNLKREGLLRRVANATSSA